MHLLPSNFFNKHWRLQSHLSQRNICLVKYLSIYIEVWPATHFLDCIELSLNDAIFLIDLLFLPLVEHVIVAYIGEQLMESYIEFIFFSIASF